MSESFPTQTTESISRKQSLTEKIDRMTDSWERVAPDAQLAGMTLAHFLEAIAPSQTLREELSQIRVDLNPLVTDGNARAESCARCSSGSLPRSDPTRSSAMTEPGRALGFAQALRV